MWIYPDGNPAAAASAAARSGSRAVATSTRASTADKHDGHGCPSPGFSPRSIRGESLKVYGATSRRRPLYPSSLTVVSGQYIIISPDRQHTRNSRTIANH